MKKIILLLCSVVLTISFFSCKAKKDNVSSFYEVSSIYVTFEDAVTQYATDIFKGKCLSVKENEDSFEYEFQILERYLGEDVGNTVHVYVRKDYIITAFGEEKYISYNEYDTEYEIDHDYYMVTSRYVGVYWEYDRYFTMCGIHFPISDLSKSTMYSEPIVNHSNISDINNEQILIDYIAKQLEENPNPERKLYLGIKPIDSTDMETIIKESEYVFKVKVGKDCGYGLEDRVTHECTIVDTLKGDLNVSNITILFLRGDVSEGKEYIVAAQRSDGNLFVVSSKNSVFKISKQDELMQYIQ